MIKDKVSDSLDKKSLKTIVSQAKKMAVEEEKLK